jgi:hypothetical protein
VPLVETPTQAVYARSIAGYGVTPYNLVLPDELRGS